MTSPNLTIHPYPYLRHSARNFLASVVQGKPVEAAGIHFKNRQREILINAKAAKKSKDAEKKPETRNRKPQTNFSSTKHTKRSRTHPPLKKEERGGEAFCKIISIVF
jgi:hypothetical protein